VTVLGFHSAFGGNPSANASQVYLGYFRLLPRACDFFDAVCLDGHVFSEWDSLPGMSETQAEEVVGAVRLRRAERIRWRLVQCPTIW